MNSSRIEEESPKALCQVFEDEFIAVHGENPSHPSAGKALKDAAEASERLSSAIRDIHRLPGKRWALCISGGGIRSASFALGVMQGLAKKNWMKRFDYLSTVSGGGYIGGWLTAWLHHERKNGKNPEQVFSQLNRAEGKDQFDQEAAPIRHLRSYGNYLNPNVGLFSMDTWALGATIIRNLFLNWTLILPLVAAYLLLPRIVILLFLSSPPNWLFQLVGVSGCLLGAWSVFRVRVGLPSIGTHPLNRKLLVSNVLLPLFASALCLSLYWVWLKHPPYNEPGGLLEKVNHVQFFICFGMGVHSVAWLFSEVSSRIGGKLPFRLFHKALDLTAVLVSGAFAGWGFWKALTAVSGRPEEVVCLIPPLILLVFMLAISLYIGLASFVTSDEDREWWAFAGAWMLVGITITTFTNVLVVYGVHWLLLAGQEAKAQAAIASVGGISAWITIFLGSGPKSSAQAEDRQKASGWEAALHSIAPKLAAPVLALLLLLLFALGTTWLIANLVPSRAVGQHLEILKETRFWHLGLLLGIFAAIGIPMGLAVNVNRFSLHAMYRNRLIRAFLGASRVVRNPEAVSGFDPKDNIPMHDISSSQRPFHVVNTAVNLAGDPGLPWQERKAETFTISPLHCGSLRLCHEISGVRGAYRPSKEYSSKPQVESGMSGISLGTAVTISGAAANSNMGYHSSPLVAFLLTFYNARLGCWLGNPGQPGKKTWQRTGPVFAVKPLVAEAFAETNDRNAYVNLSDGGHFENLGLYEMVLRRCHVIVVSDGGCDPDYSFEDLGNAIRKIRIDLGITIEFKTLPICSQKAETLPLADRRYFAIGLIRYSNVDPGGKDGVLIYVKPTLVGNEPRDVLHYAFAKPAFPNEPTTDQWFGESQFESYRMLGEHIGSTVFADADESIAKAIAAM